MVPKREVAFRHNCSLFAKALKHPFSNFFILSLLLSSDKYIVKDGEPSDCELEYLSKELGVNWEELGRRLKFNQAALTNFDEANTGLAKKAFKMLMAWKQREGCEATYAVLYSALCHELVECKRLAEQFCCR